VSIRCEQLIPVNKVVNEEEQLEKGLEEEEEKKRKKDIRFSKSSSAVIYGQTNWLNESSFVAPLCLFRVSMKPFHPVDKRRPF
jgi:hypothetical protein